jgi:hypothetical protein
MFWSGHGSCDGEKCVCDPGYSSYDCSQFEGTMDSINILLITGSNKEYLDVNMFSFYMEKLRLILH